MQDMEAVQGKKVALEVGADDAAKLRERGKEFVEALHGKTMQTNDQLLFDQMLLRVESTKPKGLIRIGRDTAVKIAITKQALRQNCSSCQTVQPQAQMVCASCGAELPVVHV